MPDYPVTSASVPANLACIITDPKWQELVNLLKVTLPDGSKINISATEPAPADRVWPWLRLLSDGTPEYLYYYANGKWLSRHPDFVGKVVMYEGTEASIDTVDGGSAGAVSASSGPFWEKVDEMDAKFPVGPGTMPAGAVIAIGGEGGEDEHKLTVGEMPSHSHDVDGVILNESGSAVGSGGSYKAGTRVSDDKGGDNAHENLPPYRAIWFIRRTARLYRTAP